MTKNILLLGLTTVIVDNAQQQVDSTDFKLSGGTSVEDIRSVFAQTRIDHVIMGGGLDLETRLQMVREIFQLSDTTTVHMKDVVSGSQNFLPFVQSVLSGLKDYTF